MKTLKTLLTGVLFLAILCGAAPASAGNTIYVPEGYPTIKEAINAASSGDTILVAPGEYNESIKLKPGITVRSTQGADVTVIRGYGGNWQTGNWWDPWPWRNSYTVYGANNSTISGFTITGSALGIYNYNTSPIITDNIFTGTGWAVTNYYSSPTITNNTFTANTFFGVYNRYSNPWIEDNTFVDGASGMYNNLSSPTIIGNTFSDHNGGGIIEWRCNSTIAGNIVTDNLWGIGTDWSTSTITNNIITGNKEGIHNHYSSHPTITNNTITGNVYGITNAHYCRPKITNNIITGNETGIANKRYGGYWGGSFPTITYNDLWDNGTDIFDDRRSHSTVADNISADPMFVEPAAGDYRLQQGSSCIDAGTNGAPGLPETDFDGNPRIFDGDVDGVDVVDMGAFELLCAQAPQFEITSFSPEYIWPPNHKTVDITLSGRVIVPAGCTIVDARYRINDEYGEYTSEGALMPDADGNFAVSIPVEAWRDGRDKDGRNYSIAVYAEDEKGTTGETRVSTVPHDMRGKK